MFDLSFLECAVLLLVALLIIKPEDVPGMLQSALRGWRSIRNGYAHFMQNLKTEMDDLSRESGMDDLKKNMHEVTDLEGEIQQAYDLETTPLEDASRRQRPKTVKNNKNPD